MIDNELWNVINNWVSGLDADVFAQVLPLLRRTFANFSSPERRRLGEKVKLGGTATRTVLKETNFDHQRASRGTNSVTK